MKKILLTLLIGMFLINCVSAVDFDNVLSYEENDMKVSFDNVFGLGKHLGDIELKSHSSVTEVKKVGFGKEEVVMYYDFTDWEFYPDGLGRVIFTDMEIGKEIEKDYKFVIWKEIEVDVNDYELVCDTFVNGTKNNCVNNLIGTHKENKFDWIEYKSLDIPEGNSSIGLKTYVRKGEYVDGVWTIVGKKVKKHITWVGDINAKYCWDFDETSGTNLQENISMVNNMTATDGAVVGVVGKIGNAIFFDGDNDFAQTINVLDIDNSSFSIGFWYYSFSLGATTNILSSYNFNGNLGGIQIQQVSNSTWAGLYLGGYHVLHTIVNGTWTYRVYVSNTTELRLYENGVFIKKEDFVFLPDGNAKLTLGEDMVNTPGREWNGMIDVMVIAQEEWSQDEITFLYNEGDGLACLDDGVQAPNVTLNKPDNATVFTTNNIGLNGTVFDLDGSIVNVSLLLDGVVNETNSSGINNSLYNFDKIMLSGDHNWTLMAVDNDGLITTADTRFLNINVSVGTELISPTEGENLTDTLVNFIVNSTSINQDLSSLDVFVWFSNGTLEFTNSTPLSGNIEVQTNVTPILLDGDYIWAAKTTGTVTTNTTSNRTFTVHTTPSSIIILFPTGNIEFFSLGDNLTLNWSITELGQNLSQHIINCSFTYNSVQTDLNQSQCIEINETSFLYISGVNNLSFTVLEEFGLTTTNTTSWTFSILENQIFFTNTTIEGVIETYTLNITLGVGESISSANFSYNGSGNSVTLEDFGNNMLNLTSQITVPSVDASTNFSFFWRINLGSVEINTTSTNQTVQNLGIDNCSINNNTIFNYTMLNEEFQSEISNANFEIDLKIFNSDKTQSILNFSESINNTNPVAICLSINLTNETVYAVDSTVKYSSIIDYVIEYYNIQNFTLKNSTIPQNINLFELLSADSTDFQITFKDSSFVTVENALIQINRQYVSEGVFKTVEIPKTDSNGQTVGHFVQNDVVYNIIVTKEGTVLGIFNNVIAFCEDATIGQCFIPLNALTSNLPVFDYDVEVGLSFDFTYNETSRILTFPFTTTDGSVKNVSLNGVRLDSLGNTSICGDFLVSASGTLTCTVPVAVGNETIIIDIFVNGDLKIQNYISAGTEFDLGDAGYFLLFFLVLSCALMLSQSKIGVIIGTIIGFIAGILLSFFKGGLIGTGSSIVWLVIWGIAIIWKLNSERQT